MTTTIILSAILLLCIILIFWLFTALNNQKSQLSTLSTERTTWAMQAEMANNRANEVQKDIQRLQNEMSAFREENGRLKERIKFIEEEKEKLAKESETRFQNIANEILTTNSRIFKEQNETRLSEILTPLKENIEQFKKTINDSYSNEARERFSLQERIKELIELNQSISK